MAKDLFSEGASGYAASRPHYPQALFDYILSFVAEREAALDCATGNGQAAVQLARYFREVYATDISEAQLDNAVKRDNITYSISAAESTPFAEKSFNLITVAQAYHWMDGAAFCREARRIGKRGSVVAVWMYNRPTTGSTETDAILDHFYHHITGPYWEPERKLVDDNYRMVPFDFDELPPKEFVTNLSWSLPHLIAYLNTWSAVQQYKKTKGASPVDLILPQLQQLWKGAEVKEVCFPIHLRIGRV